MPYPPLIDTDLARYPTHSRFSRAGREFQATMQTRPHVSPPAYSSLGNSRSPPKTSAQSLGTTVHHPLQPLIPSQQGRTSALFNKKSDESNFGQPLGLAKALENMVTTRSTDGSVYGEPNVMRRGSHNEKHIGISTPATISPSQRNETKSSQGEAASSKIENDSLAIVDSKETKVATIEETATKEWLKFKEREERRDKVYVNLVDPRGRKFKFPYRLCLTWEVSSFLYSLSILVSD